MNREARASNGFDVAELANLRKELPYFSENSGQETGDAEADFIKINKVNKAGASAGNGLLPQRKPKSALSSSHVKAGSQNSGKSGLALSLPAQPPKSQPPKSQPQPDKALLNSQARLRQRENACLTKIQRQHGRLKKPLDRRRNVRVSFRLTFNEYKALLERCGGKRRLSGFIRKALGVE